MKERQMQSAMTNGRDARRYLNAAADRASSGLNRWSDTAQQRMERVSDAASAAAARLSERGEELWDMRGRAADTARSYVREHPLTTIAVVLAIGLLISRLTSRD